MAVAAQAGYDPFFNLPQPISKFAAVIVRRNFDLREPDQFGQRPFVYCHCRTCAFGLICRRGRYRKEWRHGQYGHGDTPAQKSHLRQENACSLGLWLQDVWHLLINNFGGHQLRLPPFYPRG
jgi:hypothetical protein